MLYASGSTQMKHGSGSHAIFIITLEQRRANVAKKLEARTAARAAAAAAGEDDDDEEEADE